jgi:uncharacterized protein
MTATQDDVRRGRGTPRLLELATIFEQTVTSSAFPCIYAHIPFNQSDLAFTHHARGDAGLVDGIVSELRELVDAARISIDAMLVVFIDDIEGVVTTLEDDRELACSVVTAVLATQPPTRTSSGCPVSSQDPEWTLELDGLELFLNFSSPRHRCRRSRDVGPAFTIIAQPRESFDKGGRSRPAARALIRRRVADYDDVPPHPALGSYGDPSNREALQYFLGDSPEEHDITVIKTDEAAVREVTPWPPSFQE